MQGRLRDRLQAFVACAICSATVFTWAATAPDLAWEPVESLNADLPAGVRVYSGADPKLPLRAWYVSVAPGRDSHRVEVLVSDDPTDRRETVSSFAADTGACIVINGGYFTMERTPAHHAGLLVIDGVIEAPATRSAVRDEVRYPTARAALGLTSTGFDIAWATSREGKVLAWAAPPSHRQGTPAQLDPATSTPWVVEDALGGGPALVSKGEVNVATTEEVFFGTAIPYTHPRTAAGITADGTLLLLLVDGRQTESRGVRLEELAAIMVDLGAEEALNLDGGGSSSLVVHGQLLNNPAGRRKEREVMTALGVFCD
ncbi:MAG: phosphodiester glycosidase family protein [Gammaproteobacteria bacterium]|nr:phosphodiester glycosidase family protein [Gammaproteobacteria bacterium]